MSKAERLKGRRGCVTTACKLPASLGKSEEARVKKPADDKTSPTASSHALTRFVGVSLVCMLESCPRAFVFPFLSGTPPPTKLMSEKYYYCVDESTVSGPLPLDQINSLGLPPTAKICKKKDWQPLSDLANLPPSTSSKAAVPGGVFNKILDIVGGVFWVVGAGVLLWSILRFEGWDCVINVIAALLVILNGTALCIAHTMNSGEKSK